MLNRGGVCARATGALAWLGLASVGFAVDEPAGPVGVVTGVEGIDVELRRTGTPAQFVLLGQPLLRGDEIRVPADQSAMIFLSAARTVLQIRENSVVALRSSAAGLDVRLANGLLRVLRVPVLPGQAAGPSLTVSTPLGRSEMVAGVLEVAHQTGETAGASRSVFTLLAKQTESAKRTDTRTTVHRIDGTQATPLPAGSQVTVTPTDPIAPATALTAATRPTASWSAGLPLSAARMHRLRVADDFRNDLVQRTALAAALAAPVGVSRPTPQSIIDQPAVQPPGPTQATRIIAPGTSRASRGPVGGSINQLAQENLSNLLGFVPGRGPVPTAGPNSLIEARR